MRILIESFDYPTDILADLLPEYLWQKNPNQTGFSKTLYVGYYNNNKGRTCLILPKIFLSEENKLILNLLDVYIVAQEGIVSLLEKGILHLSFYKYLLSLSIDFYHSLKIYNQESSRKTDLLQVNISPMFLKTGELYNIDLLATILALFDFYDKNKTALFKIKKTRSAHTQKINWHKTLQNKQPYLQANAPIYWESIKEKQARLQDIPLYNLFFQVLELINQQYKFNRQDLPQVSKPIPWQNAPSLLHSWQSLYTSSLDKNLLLLLLTYFEKSMREKQANQPYFLLCTHYEYVFEAMVDKLLTQKEVTRLKIQKDGGIIDHLFTFEALLGEGKSYYIADAKYYKATTQYSTYTQYKQFVYAKNLAQDIIDKKLLDNYPCPITEAYLPIGNIFVQAHLQDWQDNKANLISNAILPFQKTQHFENRFFDRDSLILVNLKLNFNFILHHYIQGENSDKDLIKTAIRKNILSIYDSLYDIYKLTPPIDLQQFIQIHYRKLQGKIALPNLEKNECYFVIAKADQTTDLLDFLQPWLEKILFDR